MKVFFSLSGGQNFIDASLDVIKKHFVLDHKPTLVDDIKQCHLDFCGAEKREVSAEGTKWGAWRATPRHIKKGRVSLTIQHIGSAIERKTLYNTLSLRKRGHELRS